MAMIVPKLSRIVSKFPQNFSFVFAYGSGVKKQTSQNPTDNMIDFIFCVNDAKRWHEANLSMHPNHYSVLRHLGPNLIARYQQKLGAKVYYNTLVEVDGVSIKYGVMSTNDLIEDLLDWSHLYVAGRLHKPVEIVRPVSSSQLQMALQQNLQSAVATTLLLLPEQFTEYEFYHTISSLSYLGDFRMTFGENRNKIEHIVKPQLTKFRNLYLPIIKSLKDYVDFPVSRVSDRGHIHDHTETLQSEQREPSEKTYYFVNCSQDAHPVTKLHHLSQLPKRLQKNLVRVWNRGYVRQDAEDVLRAIAYDPDCDMLVHSCVTDIVRHSAYTQSLKGVLTAGVKRSFVYSLRKVGKMFK